MGISAENAELSQRGVQQAQQPAGSNDLPFSVVSRSWTSATWKVKVKVCMYVCRHVEASRPHSHSACPFSSLCCMDVCTCHAQQTLRSRTDPCHRRVGVLRAQILLSVIALWLCLKYQQISACASTHAHLVSEKGPGQAM